MVSGVTPRDCPISPLMDLGMLVTSHCRCVSGRGAVGLVRGVCVCGGGVNLHTLQTPGTKKYPEKSHTRGSYRTHKKPAAEGRGCSQGADEGVQMHGSMVPAVGGVLAVIAKEHCSHLNTIKRPK